MSKVSDECWKELCEVARKYGFTHGFTSTAHIGDEGQEVVELIAFGNREDVLDAFTVQNALQGRGILPERYSESLEGFMMPVRSSHR